MAGFVLLTIAPLALSALLLGTPGPTGGETKHDQTGIAVVRPPSVWLSIEAPGLETESPVVLPGYLLPDDGTGSEEPSHAGG